MRCKLSITEEKTKSRNKTITFLSTSSTTIFEYYVEDSSHPVGVKTPGISLVVGVDITVLGFELNKVPISRKYVKFSS